MQLRRLEVSNFRCIVNAAIDPAPGLNVICGENGAGKTSLLESVYMLGFGRSFRTRIPQEAIRHGAEASQVQARVTEDAGGAVVVAVRRDRDGTAIRYGGKWLESAAELAIRLPVLLVTADTHAEIQSLPRARRRWLDLTLFHVKPNYLALWKRYMRSLKHRNFLLRNDAAASLLQSWELELASLADQLHQARARCADELLALVKQMLHTVVDGAPDLQYFPGWDISQSYVATLARNRGSDKAAGSTRQGPHRADIVFFVNGQPIAQWLSRGQSKLWGAILLLAQAMFVGRCSVGRPIILVDDLASDLDLRGREILLAKLRECGCQVFLTTVAPATLPLEGELVTSMFHVKHGEIQEAAQVP